MNEQDLILKQKIEKREKIDTILAYILLVIISGAIFLVLYLKFIRKEEIVKPNEYVPQYISLSDISTSLNNSLLANEYLNDSANFTSTVSGNSLLVTYVKEDKNFNLNIPQVGNELQITISEDSEIFTDIYKELTTIICRYYDNTESNCRNSINTLTEESQVNGIRFVNDENNKYIYISMINGIDVGLEKIYNEITKTNISETNYTLNFNEFKIYGINVDKDETSIDFSGIIEKNNESINSVTINVKLYDVNGEIIGQNTYIFDENNTLDKKNVFKVSFEFNEEDLNKINEYSIEIVK